MSKYPELSAKLQIELQDYDKYINKHPARKSVDGNIAQNLDLAKIYYLKARILSDYVTTKNDKKYYDDALDCFNLAVSLSRDSKDQALNYYHRANLKFYAHDYSEGVNDFIKGLEVGISDDYVAECLKFMILKLNITLPAGLLEVQKRIDSKQLSPAIEEIFKSIIIKSPSESNKAEYELENRLEHESHQSRTILASSAAANDLQESTKDVNTSEIIYGNLSEMLKLLEEGGRRIDKVADRLRAIELEEERQLKIFDLPSLSAAVSMHASDNDNAELGMQILGDPAIETDETT